MNPIKKLMDNLNYKMKFLVITVLIISYASFMMYNIVSKKNDSIAFSQLEITGVKTLPAMKNLLINTQKLRGLTAAYKAGGSSLLPRVRQQTSIVKANLQAAKQAVTKADLKNIAPLFASLKQKLQNTINTALSQTKKQGFKNYTNAVNDELALIIKIGDMSNLKIDPDLETSSLIGLVINELPIVSEAAGETRGIGTPILVTQKKNKIQQIKLAALVGTLRNNAVLARNGLESAYSFNSGLKPLINPTFKKFFNAVTSFSHEAENLSQGNLSMNPKVFFQNGTDVINKVVALYDLSNKYLLKRLNIRVDKMKVARNEFVIEGIIFFLILIVLFYVAYDYLYKNQLLQEAITKEKKLLQEIQKSHTALAKSKQRYKELATKDMLTGILNRFAFEDELNKLISNSKRTGAKFALLFLDLDHFKEVNDTYGHNIGDKLLIEVAKRVVPNIRIEDIFARVGGDEFVLLFTNIENKTLHGLVNKAISLFRKPWVIDKVQLNVTTSMGAAVFPDNADNENELMKKADIAMYKSKELGRNQVVYFKKSLLQA